MQVEIFDRRAQPLEPEPEPRDFRLSVQLHSPPVVERPGCDKTGLERPRGWRGLGGQESFRQGLEGKRRNLHVKLKAPRLGQGQQSFCVDSERGNLRHEPPDFQAPTGIPEEIELDCARHAYGLADRDGVGEPRLAHIHSSDAMELAGPSRDAESESRTPSATSAFAASRMKTPSASF